MVIRKCVFLNVANKDINLCWIPSHVGIKGNEKAFSAARSALDLPHVKVCVRNTDLKHHITEYIISTWQDDWNGAVTSKLHSVTWKDNIVLCRARIGHTHLTHSYSLRKDPPPQCEHCRCILTVRHNVWSAVILQKERMYLVKEMYVSFIVNFNVYICNELILPSSLQCI